MSDFNAKEFMEQILAQTATGPVDDRAAIDSRKQSMRIETAAREELAAETMPPVPWAYTGSEFLSQTDDTPQWRIADLWPAGGNVVLAAQFKAGKTTIRDNLIKSWCDGERFLGAYNILPGRGPVFVIDAEMSASTARRWLKAHGIQNADLFTYSNIRGKSATFNLLVPSVRAEWAKRISGCQAVLLDCLGPIMGSLGLDENKSADIGRFLSAFEQLLSDAGATESFVIHHMGHGAERSRGASRLRDWPDAEWRLVRQNEDPASPRYFAAFGRDVDVAESKLGFDPLNRQLKLAGGSRASEKVGDARTALIELLAISPGLTGRAIEAELNEQNGRNAVRTALKSAVKDKEVTFLIGANNSRHHTLSSPVRHSSPPI